MRRAPARPHTGPGRRVAADGYPRSAATVTTDRYGCRAYVWPDGTSVVKDGIPSWAWTLYRPDGSTFIAPTLADCQGEA